MKSLRIFRLWLIIVILGTGSCTTAQQEKDPSNTPAREYYSAAEIDGILCGYSVDREYISIEQGKQVLHQTANVTVKLSVLGQGVDIRIDLLYKLDPSTRRWFYNKMVINNGAANVQATTEIRGDTAFYLGFSNAAPLKITLTPDVEFETNLLYPHLVRDFINGSADEEVYKVFDIFSGHIIEKKYIKTGQEDIILNDSTFRTLVLEETDLSKGTKAIIWLDAQSGFPLKSLVAGRTIYLSDKSVVGKITKVNYDNVIFARVNKLIPDFQHLSYMKVKASIESAGEVITVENLNRPGQIFTGKVNDNLVEGIFELEPAKYDGMNAPPFPPDFTDSEELKKYLEPERLIESDDPLIIHEARNITEGSVNSWDAVKRIGKWVSENIEGAVPGGTSAINTYKIRQGECGSHSRLMAALCRAAGIPARLSVGCMYTPHYMGSFGQHAWNEVFMGDAGWIPVDVTISEIDHVDAGHIRLGEMTTFQPKEMKILEYRLRGNTTIVLSD
jgi:hypothetical protein